MCPRTMNRPLLLLIWLLLAPSGAQQHRDDPAVPTCSATHGPDDVDPNLREMTYDVGDGPQTFLAYVEPDVTSFYAGRPEGSQPASQPRAPKRRRPEKVRHRTPAPRTSGGEGERGEDKVREFSFCKTGSIFPTDSGSREGHWLVAFGSQQSSLSLHSWSDSVNLEHAIVEHAPNDWTCMSQMQRTRAVSSRKTSHLTWA